MHVQLSLRLKMTEMQREVSRDIDETLQVALISSSNNTLSEGEYLHPVWSIMPSTSQLSDIIMIIYEDFLPLLTPYHSQSQSVSV